ncbi:MFS transporter [Actinokineospora soli]
METITRTLYRAQAVNAVGDGAFYVTSAVAFTRLFGFTPVQIGLALTLAWGVGFVLTAPLGALADRLGVREVAVGLSVATAVMVGLLATGWVFPAALTGYAVAQSGLYAVRQAMTAALVPAEQRTVVRARMQALANGGISVGAGIGGVALTLDTAAAYTAVFALDAVGFLIAAGLLARLPKVTSTRPVHAPRAAVLRDRPYLAATALNAVLTLSLPLLSVGLPLFIAQRTQAFEWSIAALFVLNTAGVLLLQVRAARRVTDLTSAAKSVRWAGWALLVSCLVFPLAALPGNPAVPFAVLAAGAVVQVLAEVRLAAGSWEIGFAMADPSSPGQWQGVYGSGLAVARCVGPTTLVFLLLTWSGPGWLVLGGIFLAAALGLAAVARGSAAPTSRAALPV